MSNEHSTEEARPCANPECDHNRTIPSPGCALPSRPARVEDDLWWGYLCPALANIGVLKEAQRDLVAFGADWAEAGRILSRVQSFYVNAAHGATQRYLTDPRFRAAAPSEAEIDVTGPTCADCGHVHTASGCTGPSTLSDRWAGVKPSACDCPDSRIRPAAPREEDR